MEDIFKLYNNCILCPRECKVDRSQKRGVCKSSDKCKIARAALHYWEEPCISGTSGSGTIFFEGCSLGCVFCQNYEISDSKEEHGVEVSVDKLVEIFFSLKEKGANNINFVTPTHFMPHIKKAIIKAKEQGFELPFVYNTSGYEKVECLRELEGLIDVYLPDMKYADDINDVSSQSNIAYVYSRAKDYFENSKLAIAEMYRQVGTPRFDADGIIRKGVIVRQLILPNHTKNSMRVIEYLYNTYKDDIFISIMNQYTPVNTPRLETFPKLQRAITKREYDKVIDYALTLGVKNAFIQEGGTCSESFIPDFSTQLL